MRRSSQRLALAGALSLLASCAQAPKRPAGPPSGIAVFARHPQFVEAKISPKGTYLAAISVEDGQRSLAFMRLATREFVSRLKPDRGTMVGDFHWVNDERVVAELLTMEGDLATPKRYGEIYAVDATGKNGLMVFGYRTGLLDTAAHIHKAEPERAWGRYVNRPRGDGRRMRRAASSSTPWAWTEVGPRSSPGTTRSRRRDSCATVPLGGSWQSISKRISRPGSS